MLWATHDSYADRACIGSRNRIGRDGYGDRRRDGELAQAAVSCGVEELHRCGCGRVRRDSYRVGDAIARTCAVVTNTAAYHRRNCLDRRGGSWQGVAAAIVELCGSDGQIPPRIIASRVR